mgnify:CR=1 FL=1
MKILTDNFSWWEVKCRCCGRLPEDDQMVLVLADRLQTIRNKVGDKIKITSWFRCSKHNSEVGGSPASKHLSGAAADIYIPSLSLLEAFSLCAFDGEHLFGGVGAYPSDGIIHVDLRIQRICWIKHKDVYQYMDKEEAIAYLINLDKNRRFAKAMEDVEYGG